MSERMLERHRALILASGKGNRAAAVTSNGSSGVDSSGKQQSQQTPQQKAAAALRSEDEQLDHFITRLAIFRDDSREDYVCGPSVPTALSRRLLNKQGAGFLDPTVAATVSAAADRFLATVLQQAVACRDQRLKGQEVQREAKLARKRHLDKVEADNDDRERRKNEKALKREATNLEVIAAAEALGKKGAAGAANKDGVEVASPKSKKNKKKVTPDVPTNGVKPGLSLRNRLNHAHAEDDEESVDSIDEEEDYYLRYYGDELDTKNSFDGDEEEEEALLIRDLQHPLQAWGFNLTGKLGLEPALSKNQNEEKDRAAEKSGGALAIDTGEDGEADDIDNEDPESDEDEEAMDTPGATGNVNRKLTATPANEIERKAGAATPSPAVPPPGRSSPLTS